MDFINSLIPQNYWEAIGWTLVHSIWQIMAISLLLWMVLRFQSHWTAHIRYLLGITALGLIIISSIWTFHLVLDRPVIATANHSEKTMVATEFKQAEWTHPAEIPSHNTSEQTPLLDYSLLRQNLEKYIPSLVNLWLLGALFYLFRLAGSLLNLRNLQRKHHTQVAAPLLQKVDSLIASMGFFRKVTVLKSQLIHVPVTFGIFKPVILLPVSLLLHTSPAQLEAIIAHELAHIKRYDYLVNILQSLLEVVFFFHPCFWWINDLVRTERENACDDLVLTLHISPHALATGLAEVAEQSQASVPEMALAATGNHPTLKRIKRILGLKTEKEKLSPLITLTMVASLLISASLFMGAMPASSNQASLEELLVTRLKSKTIAKHWNIPCTEETMATISLADTVPSPPATPPTPKPVVKGKPAPMAEPMPILELGPVPVVDFEIPPVPGLPPVEPLEFAPPHPAIALDLSEEGVKIGKIALEMAELSQDTTAKAKSRKEQLEKELKKLEQEMAQKTKAFEEKMAIWEEKHGEATKAWEAKMKTWEEKMKEKQADWEAAFAPKMREFEAKMRAWEKENKPKIKEFEEKMKIWEEKQRQKEEERIE